MGDIGKGQFLHPVLINELCQPPWGAGGESFPQWQFLSCGFHASLVSVLLEEVPRHNMTTLLWREKCLGDTVSLAQQREAAKGVW